MTYIVSSGTLNPTIPKGVIFASVMYSPARVDIFSGGFVRLNRRFSD